MKKQLIAMLMMAVLVMSGLVAMPAMSAKAAGDTGEETTIIEKVLAQLAAREENNVLEGAMPCRGEAHALVINVVVEGEEEILPTQTLRDMMYGEYTSPNYHHPNQNLAEYYELASYGKLHLSGDVVEYRCDEFVEENVNFLKQAIDAVMAEREPQDYDRNGDGYFDAVYFVVPSGRNTGTVSFWNYEYNGMKLWAVR